MIAPKYNVTNLVIAEFITTLRATYNFIKELGLQKIEVEEDSVQVVQALQKEDKNWCQYGQLIDNVRMVLNGLQQ